MFVYIYLFLCICMYVDVVPVWVQVCTCHGSWMKVEEHWAQSGSGCMGTAFSLWALPLALLWYYWECKGSQMLWLMLLFPIWEAKAARYRYFGAVLAVLWWVLGHEVSLCCGVGSRLRRQSSRASATAQWERMLATELDGPRAVTGTHTMGWRGMTPSSCLPWLHSGKCVHTNTPPPHVHVCTDGRHI